MKNFILAIVLLVFGSVNAQTDQELFNKGNTAYQSEKYEEAISVYQQIISNGLESVDLYLNIGNSYYKTNNMAEAIYHYEKALVLEPTNSDVKTNLEYANRSIIDNIKSVPKSVFEKFDETVLAVFSYDNWAVISVIFSLLGCAIWMIFFFNTIPSIKKAYFTLGIICSVVCLTSIVITIQQYDKYTKTNYGIIFSNQIEVKNAPTNSADEVFTLHEGTKVKIVDQVEGWNKIKISDGQLGWLPIISIKQI